MSEERTGEHEERTPEEDLAMIRRLMTEGREAADAGGPFYLLWGVAVLLGLVGTYLAARNGLGLDPELLWIGVVGAGWVGSFWLGWRRGERVPVETTGGRVMMGIWVGGGVTMTLLGFAVPAAGLVGTVGEILGPIAMVLGTCSFASSFVARSGGLRWAAVGWWAGGVAMLWWSGAAALLIMAAQVLVLMILPGLLLGGSDESEAGTVAAA